MSLRDENSSNIHYNTFRESLDNSIISFSNTKNINSNFNIGKNSTNKKKENATKTNHKELSKDERAQIKTPQSQASKAKRGQVVK